MTPDPDISRRQLLRGKLFGKMAGMVADALGAIAPDSITSDAAEPQPRASSRHRHALPIHRPPGAIDEPSFLRDCTRCDACLEVCPPNAIIHAPARMRGAAGTPMINASKQPCIMCEDTPCVTACEPGVLTHDAPLVMGRATIVEQTCLAHQGTFCTVCSEQCPVHGAIEVSEGQPIVVEDRCTGCGVCHFVCPAPQNAVIILPVMDRPRRRALTAASAPESADGQTADDSTTVDEEDDPDRIVFPHMNDAMLSADEVRQLFEDLAKHAEDLQVRIKGEKRTFVEVEATLDDARQALTSQSARGVQIRYTYDNAVWSDTLMILSDGVRLVRVRHRDS